MPKCSSDGREIRVISINTERFEAILCRFQRSFCLFETLFGQFPKIFFAVIVILQIANSHAHSSPHEVLSITILPEPSEEFVAYGASFRGFLIDQVFPSLTNQGIPRGDKEGLGIPEMLRQKVLKMGGHRTCKEDERGPRTFGSPPDVTFWIG
jgi:hypothetical protein